MGRLLRKKSPAKKKKTDSDNLSPQVSNGLDAESRNASLISEQKKQPLLPKKSSPNLNKDSYIGKAALFLREVKAELKKVTWPSRKQTMGSTVVVIVIVMIISLFLGMVDMGLSGLIHIVLG